MFSYSFLIASCSVSSLENILQDSFRFIIHWIFSIGFKSEFCPEHYLQ